MNPNIPIKINRDIPILTGNRLKIIIISLTPIALMGAVMYPGLVYSGLVCFGRPVTHLLRADLGHDERAYGKKGTRITSRITLSIICSLFGQGQYERAYGKKGSRITLRITFCNMCRLLGPGQNKRVQNHKFYCVLLMAFQFSPKIFYSNLLLKYHACTGHIPIYYLYVFHVFLIMSYIFPILSYTCPIISSMHFLVVMYFLLYPIISYISPVYTRIYVYIYIYIFRTHDFGPHV